ncbi:MAG: hypothetical protein CM15mP81_18800 [Alphaproteobacteria bacterium]|nr:MAG: hypothetical protein CM15mP81_18800 [Alphaproteobacteria bacterium]
MMICLKVFLIKGGNIRVDFYSKNESLEDAQINKVSRLVAKLQINKGNTVLDIGCGWGGWDCLFTIVILQQEFPEIYLSENNICI